MNFDQLPLDVLVLLAAGAWLVYALVIATETTLNGSQRMRHREADHTVEQASTGDHADDPDDDSVDDIHCLRHGRSVHPRGVDDE